MATWFDESRLDDEAALAAADARAARRSPSPAPGSAARPMDAAGRRRRGRRRSQDAARPRAVVAAGPDSRLLRAVLEPWCPVPFVAWPGPGLPGWAGGLDLVVVLAPDGADRGTASRGRRGRPSRLPGRRRLPAELAGRRARRRAAGRTIAADRHPRPARHRGGDAGVPRPGRARPARRRRRGRRRRSTTSPSPARRTATSPSTPPRCWRSRSPTPPRWSGAARCWRPGPRAGSPSRSAARQRPHRAGRRRRAPAAR